MSPTIRESTVGPGSSCPSACSAAEELGYDRVWLFDSPALYEDIWVHLAQIGEATDRIGLGTAVLVPSTRHVMTTASAIATVERLAPGRLVCAWGTGMTARSTMGKGALTWQFTRAYLEQLQGLLAPPGLNARRPRKGATPIHGNDGG